MSFWRELFALSLQPRRRAPGFLGRFVGRPEWKSVGPADPPVAVSEPSLIVQLLALRERKGAALTAAEVTGYLDMATSIAMPLSEARELAARRGYEDLDPGNLWAEWQSFLASADDEGGASG